MKPLVRIYAPIFALMVSMSLCGCQLAPNPSGNFQVTETSAGPSGSELETIRLNNCDGKADTTQVVERGQTVQIEGGAQLGVSIEVIQAAVTGKYSKGFSYKKSQMLTAPPGTNMEFTLEWTMEERVGTVAKDGQAATKAGYRYLIPTYVQIRSQKDLGGCAGASPSTLPAPSASKVTPPIQPPTATPLPAPTPLADTPPGTILEVGQTWRQGGVELRLVKTEVYPKGLLVQFRLTNLEPYDKALRYSPDNFSAVDNRSQRVPAGFNLCGGCFYFTQDCPPATEVLHAKGSIGLGISCETGDWTDTVALRVDTADSSINMVTITVSGISSVSGARWRIPLYH
jgi:hypothetical protein